MYDTFFYIQINGKEGSWAEFGPYLSFSEAAEVFVDHCDVILACTLEKVPAKYDAAIVECILRNGSKEQINIKVIEKRDFRGIHDE